jgi:chemotaxis protein CheC
MTVPAGTGPPGLEALRRLSAEGGAEAARALGRLLGCDTSLGAVEALAGPAGHDLVSLAGPGELVAVAMELEGRLGGRLLLLAGAEDAERLATHLAPAAAAGSLDAVGESALVEAGNIAGSAFVSAVARQMGARTLHRVPRLARGSARACFAELTGRPSGPALVVRFGFGAAQRGEGILVFLPDPALVAALETAG